MSDLISRQAVMKEFSDFVRRTNNSDFAKTPTWNDAVSLVGSLPSAQQWIPVTERLPEYGEEVIADFRNEQIGRDRIGVSYCYVQKEGFFSDVPFEYKVIAWMPLPVPWRGEEE